jgi:hypothetical protein
MQLTPDRRAFMVKNARKYALDNFVHVRSMQKYLQLYFDLVGREALATADVPVQDIDESIPEPTAEELAAARMATPKINPKMVNLADLSEPDSLESKARAFETPPQQFAAPPPRPEVLRPPKPEHEGDVLQSFESSLTLQDTSSSSPMTERARGVADDLGDLLSPEMLHSDEPAPGPRPTTGPARSSAAAAKDKGAEEAAKLKKPVKVPQNPNAFAPLQLEPDPPAPLARAGGESA